MVAVRARLALAEDGFSRISDSQGDISLRSNMAISRAHGKKLQEIVIERDCQCTSNEQKQTQQVTAPQEEGLTTGQKIGLGVGGALATIGIVACAIAEPCGAAALGVLGAGGTAALIAAP